MNKDNDSNQTYVGKHALDRLQEVEKDHQRAYKKRSSSFNFNRLIMVLVFALIVGLMIYSMFRQ
ncbi:hypothetical protein [Lactobacillus kalixensis]|uniref:Uncharacterized protein n=1 Tax=Lactobacillus kalixensis DSM 16043 TaxID=1423763 RepID=A0A0R1UA36_9LACO|nr:hypothetical protein [Lactobacillus kalixensis]KRL90214.1 hypothetical protein FC46_GL000316 [Lactobacillus kalixensis DSM 16043]